MSAQSKSIIQHLNLTTHPEGGWYRRLFCADSQISTPRGMRPTRTSIYYLLEHGQQSCWHVILSTEIWHFYAGGPLELVTYNPVTQQVQQRVLGDDREAGQLRRAVVPGKVWQCARSLGPYALLVCDVAPGFDFADFQFVRDIPDAQRHFQGEMAALQCFW
ncbi:cupin domain-containing protein [Acidithiobacillus marinus]|nr:cupin domain-containing protein [Acidithiobacillus marinus]